MNTLTFRNRIKDLYTKKGELKSAYYKNLFYLTSLARGERVHLKIWARGQKSHMTLIDRSPRIKEVLNKAKISYTIGNDAPRGGQEGYFLKLTDRGLRQIRNVDFSQI